MSDYSEEDIEDSRTRALPRTSEAAIAARKITALSDDDSENESPRLIPSSKSFSKDDLPSNSASPASSVNEPHENESSPARLPPKRPSDCYERSIVSEIAPPKQVDLIYLPPNVSFPVPLTATPDDVPIEQNPILYRLRQSVEVADNETPVDALLRELKRVKYNPLAYREFLESNANLVTWSDGSRTLSVGTQQFLLIDDAHESQKFVFRRGNKIQICDSSVRKVSRVQPSSTGDAHAKLVMSKALERSRNKQGVSKTMLRTLDAGAENKERQARIESQKREREWVKLEAKKRQVRERYSKPSRPLSVGALESGDDESEEDGVRRMEERVDANRLMRAKRPVPQAQNADIAVKRRKAGARRFIVSDDEEESE